MTSNLKGFEPPLPTGPRIFPFPPPSRTPAHTFQQPPRSWPRQTSTPTHNAPARTFSQDALEPSLKRQKLEDGAGFPSSGVATVESARRNTFEVAASSQHTSSDAQHEKQPRFREQPLFPLRPGRRSLGSTQQSRPLAIERAARRDVVPVKAYVPEPPSCAPRYHQAGVYLTFLCRSDKC